MTEFKPTLSVVTVVYNNVNDIERTMLSVLGQTYDKIEYIIIDGLSNDGTVDIIDQYRSQVAKLISESDKGIYDAMNKGIAAATGDYIIFMNSGDEFYAADTVEQVFASGPNADIYYGETEMINSKGESLGRRRHKAPEKFNWKGFKLGMSISHQAIYVKRSIAAPYSRKYQLSSDIDWIIRVAKKARKIVNVHCYVAKYMVGGMSKKRHLQSLKERFAIMCKHYGVLSTLFNHGIIAANLGWYYLLHRRTND